MSCSCSSCERISFTFAVWSIMLAVVLLYGIFVHVEVISLYLVYGKFYHKRILNFVNCVCCIHWDDHMIFISCFVNVLCNILTDLRMLDHPYIPRLNHTWLWIRTLFVHYWVWLVIILWKLLPLCPSGTLAFNFLVVSLFVADFRVVMAL